MTTHNFDFCCFFDKNYFEQAHKLFCLAGLKCPKLARRAIKKLTDIMNVF